MLLHKYFRRPFLFRLGKKRLHVYHSQTAPLIDWYKNEKKYQHINGLGTMEGIFAEICEAIDKL